MSDLAERYGTTGPARRTVLVAVVAVVALAGLAWLTWAALFHGRPLVQSSQVGFEVTDSGTAEATFTVVRRSRDVEASCLLRAQAADHAIVGERHVTVGPEQPERVTLTESLRTVREATTVTLLGCTAPGQDRRR